MGVLLELFIALCMVGHGSVVVGTSALSRENPGSNPLAAVSKLWQFHSSHFATVHSAVLVSAGSCLS